MKDALLEILLVDDSEDDILLVQEALRESRQVRLLGALRSGEEALSFLRREGAWSNARPPDLVLLDINMPGWDGFRVLREIKNDPGLRHIPVVMLSTSERDTDVEQAYASGACSYLHKPEAFDELVRILKGFEGYWTGVSKLPDRPD